MNSNRDKKGRVLRQGERQRSDGRYEYRYTDVNGSVRSVYSWKLVETDKLPAGKADCKPLRELEREALKLVENGVNLNQGKHVTVNELYERLLMRKKRVKQSTKLSYGWQYDKHIRPKFGDIPIADIKQRDIYEHYLWILENNVLAKSSLTLIHILFSQLYETAQRDGLILADVEAKAWDQIQDEYDFERQRRSGLTEEQQEAFLSYASKSKYACHMPLITFLLGTGCRIGEAAALRWEDCDFSNGMIHITKTYFYASTGNGERPTQSISIPKTKNAIRSIPMLPDVKKALETERTLQELTGIRNENTIDGYSGFVFCTGTGGMLKRSDVWNWLKHIQRDYNKEETAKAYEEKREPVYLPDFSAHSLRHTFCTRLCENEQNLKIIQDVMGHGNITTTMNIYNEATEKKKKEAFARLSEKISIA